AIGVGGQGDAEAGLLVDADDTGVVGGGQGGVAADVAVVLVGDPGLVAQVRGGDQFQHGGLQLLAQRGQVDRGGGGLERVGLQGVLPVRAGVRTVVDRAVVGDGARVHVDDDLAVPGDDQPAGVGDLAEPGVLHGPLVH